MAIEVRWYEDLLDPSTLSNQSCGVGTQEIFHPNTLTELYEIATSLCNKLAFLRGLSTAGDGMGGIYWWNRNDNRTDDGISIIKPNDNAGAGRWNKLV